MKQQFTPAGVDVSKRFSDLCILSPDNEVFTRAKVYHDLTSMERSLELLRQAEKKFGVRPVMVMESTSRYHLILFHFFQNAGYEVIVVNLIQSGALKNITRFKNHLADLLDQIFPGYDKVFSDVDGDFSLFHNPKELAACFGLDPGERQSGTFHDSKNRMSKRGPHYVRAMLHMAVHNCVHCGIFYIGSKYVFQKICKQFISWPDCAAPQYFNKNLFPRHDAISRSLTDCAVLMTLLPDLRYLANGIFAKPQTRPRRQTIQACAFRQDVLSKVTGF